MKKLFITLFICMILTTSLVSAFEFDNIQDVKETIGKAGYKDIEIKNAFGLGNTLWSGTLDYNSEGCINCEAIQTITLNEKGSLVDDVIFKTLQKDESWKEEPIKDYNLQIKIGETSKEVNDYDTECIEVIGEDGSNYDCEKTKTGSHTETEEIWEDYIIGTELEAGIYKLKLEGRKEPSKVVDWIYVLGTGVIGKIELSEWADWVSSDLSTGLIGYYNLDEPTGNYASSISGLSDGVPTTITQGANGKLNEAAQFPNEGDTGDSKIIIPDHALMDTIVTEGTWSFWLSTYESGRNMVPISRNDDSVNKDWMVFISATSPLTMQFFRWTGDALVVVLDHQNADINDGDFHHYVFTKNSTGWFLYMDGVTVDTDATAGNIDIDPAEIYIGARGDGARELNGTIDEIGFWNISLSNQQIEDLYNGGAGLPFAASSTTVTLNAPIDNVNSSSSEVEFNATAIIIGGTTIVNMSLFHNASGTFERNQTNSVSGTINSTKINATFADGTYLWTYEMCDSDSTCTFATTNRTFKVDTTVPQITINLPITLNNIGFADINETLNWTIIESNLDSIWVDYNGTNTTLFGLVNETSFKLEQGVFNLILYANDTFGNINSKFHEWGYKIFENSETFNASTFETGQETYSINVTANSSLTAANLIWNGTSFAGTQSGNVWSKTIDIPTEVGNKSFHWNFTYGGSTISSKSNDVLINDTNFSICGGDGGDTIFLNISFQDEADLSLLNASIPLSTFTYYLGSGTITKTLEFINNTNNFEYNFCATPNRTLKVLPNLQYKQGLAYPQRIWNPEVTSYTNTITDQILYLLNAIDGIFVTFQTVNSAEQPLSGVDITVVRSIGGSDFEVGTGTTTASGSQTFFLNPDFIHIFTFVKEGFTTFVDSFAPTQSSYTIFMGGTSAGGIDYSKGITYSIKPSLTQLTNDTTYAFNLTLASGFWDVSQFGITLRLSNGTILQSTTQNTNGGTLNLNQDTDGYDSIIMDYFWVINSTQINNSRFWTVYNTESTQWSIARFFTDLTLYLNSGIFGLDDFGVHLIVFIVIFLSVGIMSFKYGLVSPMAISTIVFALIYFFDVVMGLIPNPIGAIQNFPTIVAGITLVTIIIREVQR